MSSNGEESAEGEPTDIEVFEEAHGRFLAALDGIEADDAGSASALMQAVNAFLSRIAGLDPDPMLRRYCIEAVSERVDFMTKTEAEKQLNNHLRDARDTGRPEILDLLDASLERIEKLVSDESESEARYRIVFDDEESIIIDAEQYYSPTKFCRAYNALYGVLPRFSGSQDEWESFLHAIQQERLINRPDSVGPRSAAIQQLRSKIERSEAYLDVGDAIRNSGTYIDADSIAAAESGGTVWISSEEIRRICDEHEITPEALRIEMDNRELRAGSSTELRYNGRRAYFWPLAREEFDPRGIEGDAQSGDDEEVSDQ